MQWKRLYFITNLLQFISLPSPLAMFFIFLFKKLIKLIWGELHDLSAEEMISNNCIWSKWKMSPHMFSGVYSEWQSIIMLPMRWWVLQHPMCWPAQRELYSFGGLPQKIKQKAQHNVLHKKTTIHPYFQILTALTNSPFLLCVTPWLTTWDTIKSKKSIKAINSNASLSIQSIVSKVSSFTSTVIPTKV